MRHESALRTWCWIAVMLAIILGTGFFSYAWVSDRGQPGWNYRAIRDVPGQSPYAVYAPLPNSQHIRGRLGE